MFVRKVLVNFAKKYQIKLFNTYDIVLLKMNISPDQNEFLEK